MTGREADEQTMDLGEIPTDWQSRVAATVGPGHDWRLSTGTEDLPEGEPSGGRDDYRCSKCGARVALRPDPEGSAAGAVRADRKGRRPCAAVRTPPLSSRDRAEQITWASIVALVINVVLCGTELAAGVVGRSQVVVADAFHTLSDTLTGLAVLVGVRYWSRPADPKHPHGHGRIESLVTLSIGGALCAVAVGLTWNAIETLRQGHAEPPGLIALAAALLVVVTKETLYHWTVRVGRRAQSSALVASARHQRSDALSSVPAVLAVLAVRINPAWLFVDHVGAIVVSVFIFRAGVQVTWPALSELIDVGVSGRELERIREIALQTDGVREVHAIRTRLVGSRVHVDLHILVEGTMAVRDGHLISERVKDHLLAEGPGLVDVVVHLEPYDAGPAASHSS